MTDRTFAGEIMTDALVWDAHACLPLLPNHDMRCIERHLKAGVSYLSINVGMDFNPLSQVMRVIAGFRHWLAEHNDQYVLARSVDDIRRAKADRKLAVGFDLEGSVMLLDDLAMIPLYRDMGVRQIHLAYNRDNSVAGGCYGGAGLTALGRHVVEEINRAGLIIDCSHSSYRTSMDVMEVSSRPVVFSHSNVSNLRNHARNIGDDQIDACARTDGVIGLSGIGIFIGANDTSVEGLVRHIDYIVQRVGPRHAGLGLDFVFEPGTNDDPPELEVSKWWPSGEHDFNAFDIVPPERFPDIAEALARRGYPKDSILGILGGNFARVATATWIPA